MGTIIIQIEILIYTIFIKVTLKRLFSRSRYRFIRNSALPTSLDRRVSGEKNAIVRGYEPSK